MYGDGSHAPDSCWSPSSAVSRRLQNSCDVHASRSAERSTICSNLSEEDSKRYVGIEGATTSLAKLALARSMCPLPPLSDGIYGGGSSVPCGLHLASDVCLESLERSAPHRIVVPQIEVNNGRQFSARGELDGNINTIKLGEEKAAIWNAVSALASLCDETQELDQTFQTKLLPAIVLFGADDASALPGRAEKKDLLNEEVQEKRESKLLARLGESMKVLQMAANATTRLKRLVKNMVVQLGAVQTPSVVQLYFDNKSNDDEDALEPHDALSSGEIKEDAVLPPVFGEGVPMFRLGKSIAVALRLLISVDKSVSENQNLNEAWGMYKDVVVEMSEQKRTTDGDIDDDFESFERMLVQLENTLLSSRSFLSAIEQNFDPSGRFKDTGFQLHEEVRIHLITLYGSYCEKINTPEETTERLDCIGVYAMYVLYRQLLPSNVVPDKSLHKSLWTVFPAMCPVMQLYGPLYFQPREFLMVYSPYKAVKGCFADSREIHAQSKAAIIKWDGSFDSRVARIRFEAVGWLAKADSELCGETLGSHSLEDEDELAETEDIALKVESATNVIFRGIKIALSAHKALNLGVAKQHIPSINSLMEVLKSIEKMLRSRRRHSVSCIQRATLKMIAASILRRFESVREFVDGMSSSADLAGNPDLTRTIVRVGACLTALEGLLKGSSSFSPIRRHAIAFTIAACMDSTILEVFSTDDLLRVESSLKDLSQVASLEEIIKQACDCSFLCFHRDLALECLRHSFQANLKSPINHTQLVLSAFSGELSCQSMPFYRRGVN
ncbi:hypothetical protein THAOC_10317 [Thalassiosira oceanica]|uniref:WASH complex subunit 4 N-terminal domain-containing protein n=1 Tax=Thalassiosira oceanica TaxID=159749 RepID=K0T568_THAOC|nr:hypothetical protein THAOC_10317 [Thalassiosira oceanica]|eukprot:EJK68491.1 hypothetical protein THAOC_10317 [Thalassiosira oceanica]